MNIFNTCQKINNSLLTHDENQARDELIQLLDYHEVNNIEYSPLVNHLIRTTGLYPYIKLETTSWPDRYVYEIFKVDIGDPEPVTLHREQSSILKRLVNGENIAVSAPTSFGKSFIIDAFISIRQPKTVLIIVPTIALTDETRRRLYKKFADRYKIITTTETELGDRNILIFPQERAMNYVDKIQKLDFLVVDEFYKVSPKHDKERSPALIKAIIKLGKIAKQKYYLAPNITDISENALTKDMYFENKLNFNTVFLEKHELYKKINSNEELKSQALISILTGTDAKSLIYAASYTQIDKVSQCIIENIPHVENPILNSFSNWLSINYEKNWQLTNLIKRATGIHNGQMHRSLSQIQIKLFEEKNGLKNIISTSSIIEGVNTSAENIIIWRNKKGNAKLDDFTYKNIIGRGGRMFKHFVGKIYLLEKPPEEESTQLDIDFPDTILGDIDEVIYKDSLNQDQVNKIITFKKEEMIGILGLNIYKRLFKENTFQLADTEFIKEVAIGMTEDPHEWSGLSYLNSTNIDSWDRMLYQIIKLQPGNWGVEWNKFVHFIKILSDNWVKSIPQLLEELDIIDIGIESFFKLERNVAFKFAALIHDVNILQKEIIHDADVAPFVSKLSHVFLPSVVYQLEEYGLPRMLSRKLHLNGIIDFENQEISLHTAINLFNQIGKDALLSENIWDDFDKYILEYFYDGITINDKKHITISCRGC